ncbi:MULTISPECIES: MgtC/SapB family protein [unclassified Pseudomonas]|uniref:MgtC/SapB family protein n=1 Tax=unclassified Pseudomonas TaxID=196821 RepID=UPI00244A65E7|nr:MULTISPECIES: MgtC/SapB family protein [unclassified Pseudomonas]MDG9930105.1 MgtC/SapB family protein [Pseudomonas sp. GD04042]MDH0483493.1 MgtC/SapB family protein [Pseudomonas sp. GD04015]MDH0605489.1 MgtC/SapB family protein [Pseudomonas sp. GD03869]
MELSDYLWAVVYDEFADLGQPEQMFRAGLRLVMAAALGGLLGFEREAKGKAAGLRTHMMVTLGAALFVMVLDLDGAEHDAISRAIQGIAAGIGFLCAGTILKGDHTSEIKGLTTSASLWFSTGIGIAVGLGREGTALLGTVLALLILHALPLLEREARQQQPPGNDP